MQGTRSQFAGRASVNMDDLINASLVDCGPDGALSMHHSIAIMARYIILNHKGPATTPIYRMLKPKERWLSTTPNQVCARSTCTIHDRFLVCALRTRVPPAIAILWDRRSIPELGQPCGTLTLS